MTVLESLWAQARAHPDRAAIIDGGRVVTYRLFAALVARVRQALAREPLDRGRVAALVLPDALGIWIVGMALRSLGMTTVVVGAPEFLESLGFGEASVVATPQVAPDWASTIEAAAAAGRLVRLDLAAVLAGARTDPTPPAPPWDGPSGGHIQLTSGTTGHYKKILIDAAAEARIAGPNAEAIGLTEADVVNVFDFPVWTAGGHNWPLSAWRLGAAAATWQGPEPWRALAPPGAPRTTVALTTPTSLRTLLQAPLGALARDDALRVLVVGGVVPVEVWRATRERLTEQVLSIYGATETCLVGVTPVRAVEDLERLRVSPGAEVQVVDDDDRPLPAGELGVLRVRPTRVAGYLDDAEASATMFRDGFFYPGDLGVLDAAGRLALRGRVGDVINLRDRKTPVQPIEAALLAALGAVEVCVLSVPGATGEGVHVVIQPGRAFSVGELRAALQAAIPSGVAAVQVHRVDSLPRNVMGKVERRTLLEQLRSAAPSVPPAPV